MSGMEWVGTDYLKIVQVCAGGPLTSSGEENKIRRGETFSIRYNVSADLRPSYILKVEAQQNEKSRCISCACFVL